MGVNVQQVGNAVIEGDVVEPVHRGSNYWL